jgi:hypothetical protein
MVEAPVHPSLQMGPICLTRVTTGRPYLKHRILQYAHFAHALPQIICIEINSIAAPIRK